MFRSPLILLLCFFFAFKTSSGQDKQYKFTVAGGGVATLFFLHTKQPGFTLKLWGEKKFRDDDSKYLWLALEYSRIGAASKKTELFDPTGTGTVTYTYHPSSLLTLTLGGRKYLENNLVWGIGMGLGLYGQGLTDNTYSEPLFATNFNGKNTNVNWGIGSVAQIGYLFTNIELSLNYHGVWAPFRTVDLGSREDKELSSFVAAFGVTVGYSF